MWQYLGGKWWPQSTSQDRHPLLRANRVSASPLGWAFAAACVFAVIALAGYWIVLFQIVRTPPNVLPDLSYPSLTVALVLAMSSLVSPIVEEVGFRGYCQQILEREFVPQSAIAISSLLFMLAHANHGWCWPKLLVYFLAGLAFGAIAYLTNSILASIPVHTAGDAIFFTLI